MTDVTIHGLANELTAPGPNDELGIWNLLTSRYEKIKQVNLVGATIGGGGTIVLGGHTFTIPADGTAALVTTGTWTPGLTFGGGAVGITYGVQVGRYIRIGGVTHAWGYLTLTNKGSSTAQVRITGLPIPAANVTNYNQAVNVRLDGVTSISGALMGFIAPNATVIRVEHLGTGTAAELQNTNFTNTSSVMVSAIYEG